jgi:hypothetical protein
MTKTPTIAAISASLAITTGIVINSTVTVKAEDETTTPVQEQTKTEK